MIQHNSNRFAARFAYRSVLFLLAMLASALAQGQETVSSPVVTLTDNNGNGYRVGDTVTIAVSFIHTPSDPNGTTAVINNALDIELTLPNGLSATGSATCTKNGAAATGNGSCTNTGWTGIDLDPTDNGDQTYTLTVTATIQSPLNNYNYDVAGTLNVSSVVTAPDPASDINTDIGPVDLELALSASPSGPVVLGTDVTFTVTISNTSTQYGATGVGWSLAASGLPSGYTLKSGSLSGSGLTVPAGGTATSTFVLTAGTGTSSSDYTVAAEVTAVNELDRDSTPNNGVSSNEDDDDTLTVTAIQQVDLDLSFSNPTTPPSVDVGTSQTYEITLTNNGPSSLENGAFALYVPTGYTISNGGGAVQSSGGKCVTTTGCTTLTWSVSSLAANVSLTRTVILAPNAGTGTSGDFKLITEVTAVNDSGGLSWSSAETLNNYSNTVPTGENDEDTLDLQLADVSVALEVNGGSPNPYTGSTVPVVIALGNAGVRNTGAVNVCLTYGSGISPNISGVSGLSVDSSSNICADGVLWSVTDVPTGTTTASGAVAVSFTVDVAATGNYNLTAEVVSEVAPDSDSVPNNKDANEDDQVSVTLTPVENADLSLTMTVDNNTPVVGDTITFTLQVDNAGPNDVTGVSLQDTVPDGFGNIGGVSNGGSISGSVITWSGISIAAGGSITRSFSVEVLAGGNSYLNEAEITASALPDTDSTPNNGITTEDDYAELNVPPPLVDLAITAEGGPEPARAVAGAPFGYAFRVSNDSFIYANNSTVSDPGPLYQNPGDAGLDPNSISWTCQAYSTDAAGNVVETSSACCVAGGTASQCGGSSPVSIGSSLNNHAVDLPPNSFLVFKVSGTLDARSSTAAVLNNAATAQVPTNLTETDTSNNTGIDVLNGTSVYADADLSLSKTAQAINCPTTPLLKVQVSSGGCTAGYYEIVYEIQVSNDGPSKVSNATVSDVLTSEYFSSTNGTPSWTCTITTQGANGESSCTASGSGDLVDNALTLEPGAVATYTFTTYTAGDTGRVANTATVTVPTEVTETNPSNNSDTEIVGLSGQADLSVSMSAPPTVVAGEQISWSMLVSNTPDSDDALGTRITDLFPPQVENVRWTCSAVTPIPGDLSAIDLETSPSLLTPVDLLFSSLGDQLYALGADSDAIVVYRREVVQGNLFGALTLIDTEQQGVNSDNGQTVEGLTAPVAMALSPDQRFLYAVSAGDSAANPAVAPALIWFNRDSNPQSAQYGELTYAGSISLARVPTDLLVSPDGQHLYVLDGTELTVYDRDTALGTPGNARQAYNAGGAAMVFVGGGSHVLLGQASGVQLLQRDDNSNSTGFGLLQSPAVATVSSPASRLLVSPDEKWVLAANGSTVNAHALDVTAGTLNGTPVSLNVVDNANTAHPVQGMAISPDGEHVLLLGGSFRGYYRLDATTGVLSKEDEFVDTSGKDSRVAAFSPDGRHVIAGFVKNPDDGLDIYDRKAPDPILSFLEQDYQGDPTGVDGLTGATALALRDDGTALYATGIAGQGSLVWFTRDENKGKDPATAGDHLVYGGSLFGGANGIPSMRDVFDIEPLNGYLYLASQADNRILIFSVVATQIPQYVGEVTDAVNLAGVSGLVADPARNVLYAASLYKDAVVVYAQDSATGLLTQMQVIQDSDAGVSGLDGAFQLALTPDGSNGAPGHLLVTSSIADQLVVFSRDNTGLLTYETAYANVGDRPLAVVTTADGRHVYVGGANSHSITVLQRVADDARSDYGSLAVLGQYVDGLDGVAGIRGVRGLAMSPDDRRLYVAAEVDGSLSVFDRNDEPTSAEFGQLTQVLRHEDNINGVDGLEQVYATLVSADGRFVYTAALADNAVASFAQGTGSRCPASGTGNLNQLLVDVAAGGNLRFEVIADVLSSATVGSLSNTMTVEDPQDFNDTTPSVSDTQTTNLLTRVDLQISKTDNRVSATAGEALNYEIVVRNQGPSDAIHQAPDTVMIRDVLDSAVFDTSQVSWTCEATGSGRLTLTDLEYDGLDQADGLGGASAVAIAPPLNGTGGVYVYATGLLENALAVFQLDTATGQLSFVQKVTADASNPLVGASDVQVSTDGQYVFVSAQISDAVSVYQVSETGGYSLTLIDSVDKSANAGLDQAVALSRPASNGDLFVAGARNNSLVQLNFDGSALSVAASFSNNTGGVSQMQGPVDVLLSAAGDRVVVAASASNALVFFVRDPVTGSLSFQRAIAEGDSLGGDTVSGLLGVQSVAEGLQGGQSYLYAVGRDSDAVVALSMTDSNGDAQWVQQLANGSDLGNFDGPVRMAISPDALHLYVAAVNSASLSRFGIATDGSLRLQQQLLSSDGQPALTQPNGLAFSQDGRFLAGVSGDTDALALYQRKADTLCPDSGDNASLAAGIPVTVARGGEVRLNLQVVVKPGVTTTVSNTATVEIGDNSLDTNAGDNSATDEDQLDQRADLSIQKWDDFNQFDGLAGVTDIVFTATGSYFYTAGNQDNALGVWDNTGTMPAFVQVLRNNTAGNSGFSGITALAISPDDAHLYAVSALDNALLSFRIEADGTLIQLQDLRDDGTIQGLGGAVDVAVSPDGAHVYALGRTLGAVAVFSRDEISGELSFQSVLRNAVNGVQNMSLPDALAISADGEQLYVVSQASNALVVLGRGNDSQQAGYGDLNYLASHVSGVDGVTDMVGPSAVWPDAGNNTIYVAASDSRAVVWFTRQPDGSLAFAGSLTAQAAGTAVEFTDIRAMLGSPAGDALFVLSGSGNALNRLARNTTDGSLSPDVLVRENDPTAVPTVFVHGLRGGRAMALDAASGDLWTAAADSSALAEWDVATALVWEQALVDEGGGVAPGDSVTYHILVTNHGPATVSGARVRDTFPLAFTTVSWACQQDNTVCTPSGTGDLDTLVNLAPGAQVEFVATANVSTEASGLVVNTATVTTPAGVLDPDPSNNQASDENTVLIPEVDVVVTLDNGQTALQSGQAVTYTMTLSNNGPSHAASVTARLQLPEGVGFSSWSCQATPLPGLLQDASLPATELDVVRQMVMSTDQNDLYVVGQVSGVDVLVHYHRDLRTGELVLQGLVQNNTTFNGQAISNLDGAADVVISPNGTFIYVAAPDADAILLFQRDPVDGSLTYGTTWIDQVAGVDGLAGVHSLALSTDGSRLYALAGLDDSLTRFDVDALGQLSWQQTLFAGSYPELQQPLALAVAANGRDLYLLTGQNQLVVLQHGGLGDLQPASSLDLSIYTQFGNPLDLRLTRDETALLVLGAANNGQLLNFVRDAASGLLLLDQNQPLSLTAAPSGMLPVENGQQVLIADGNRITLWEDGLTGYDNIASFTANQAPATMLADGGQRLVYLGGSGIQLVNRLQGSRCGSFGYGSIFDAVSLSAGGQAVYTLNTSVSSSFEGTLSLVGQAIVNLPTIERNPLDNAAVDADPVSGMPTLDGTLDLDNPPLVAGLDASYSMTVDNTGNADAMMETLSVALPWQPDQTDGFDPALTVLQCTGSAPLIWTQLDNDARVGQVDRLLASADGKHLYGLDGNNGRLLSWSINAGVPQALQQMNEGDSSNGLLVEGLAGAQALHLSPNGDNLYVLASSSDRILVFRRDVYTGTLELIQRMENAPDQAVNLVDPRDMVITPNGLHAYVASSGADTISRFDRDPASGVLAWAGQQRDGFDTIFPESNVLRGVNALALADDGRVLYATASTSDTISAFLIDSATGALNYQQVVRNNASVATQNGSQTLRGLSVPGQLHSTMQGRFLYVLAEGSGNLFVFSKAVNGTTLTLVQTVEPGVGDIPAFAGPYAMGFNDDASRLYLSAAGSAELLVFRRSVVDGSLRLLRSMNDGDTSDPHLADVRSLVQLPGTDNLMLGGMLAGLQRWQENGFAACATELTGIDARQQLVDLEAGATLLLSLAAGQLPPERRNDVTAQLTVDDASGNNLLTLNRVDTPEVHTDMVVTLQQTDGRPIAGEPLQVTATISNGGPSSLLGGSLDLTAGASWTPVDWTCTGDGVASCDLAGDVGAMPSQSITLPPGSMLTFVFNGDVDPGFINQVLSFVATGVTEAGAIENDPADDVAQLDITIAGEADIALTATVDSTWIPGTSTQIVLDITNLGPSHSNDSALTALTLPSALIVNNASCTAANGGTCPFAGNTLPALPAGFSLPVGGSVSITIDGALFSSEAYDTPLFEATAREDQSAADDVTDPDLGNNSVSQTVTIQPTGDLSITGMSDSEDPYDTLANNNQPLSYTINWLMNGPSDAVNPEILVTVTSGLILQNTPGCTQNGNQIACALPDTTVANMPASGSVVLTFDASGLTVGQGTARAEIQALQVDSYPDDNLAEETTTFQPSVDLETFLTQAPAYLVPGDAFTLVFEVENHGSADVGTFSLQIDLDQSLLSAGVQLDLSNCPSCTQTGNNPVVVQGPINGLERPAIGLSATLDANLDVSVNGQLDVTGTATVVVGDADKDGSNNTVQRSLTISDTRFADGFEDPAP